MNSVSPQEIIWTVVNVFGAYWAAQVWRRARASLDAARHPASGAADPKAVLIAQRNRRDETIKMTIHSLFFLVGIAAMLAPDPASATVNTVSLLAGLVLIVASFLLAISSRLNLRDDDYLMALLEADEARDAEGDDA